MKTAVSVPTEVYEQAEELAQRTGRTRSEIYSTALRDYLAHQQTVPVTAAMDQALEEIDPKPDPFLDATARETLAEAEWWSARETSGELMCLTQRAQSQAFADR